MSGQGTASQTVGPFFSIGFAWMERTDLTEGANGGERITIQGRVFDGDGTPVPDAVLEIWQADAQGHYAYPENDGPTSVSAEFFGFGRVPTNDQGEFRFTTIRPGPAHGPDGVKQAPHIVVGIFMRGLLRRLVTRIYFAGEPANENDAVLKLIPAARRQTLLAHPNSADKQTLIWDVHLQGDNETVFFDC
jgi:protocatechuate 3,4-dioxygenase, alpha subunit